MIVPASRLLFWFALVVLPFSTLGALHPPALAPALVLTGALLALIITDAALATGRLQSVSVEVPEITRFSKDRPGNIAVILGHPGAKLATLRLALGLPRDLGSREEEQVTRLPAGAERSRLDWPCLPVRRGRFELRQAFVETASPLGFWHVRRTLPLRGEVRVYPNLMNERQHLAALFLNRGAFGTHAQRMVGKGRDFEKLREYIPGDSYDDVHWKATAKRGRPVTKVFQIERTQEVYCVLDASRLSARRPGESAISKPGETSVFDRFITSALILAQAAEKQGDLFGLLTFSDRPDLFLRARHGQHHYAACRDALYTAEARNVTPDFDEIASFIRTRLRRRALLIVLTSLDDPMLAEGFLRNMTLLAGQHLVLVNMIQPHGVRPLFTDADTPDLDAIYRHLGGHMQWMRLQELRQGLQHRGVRFELAENERLATGLVTQYITVKQRQLI